MADVETIKGEAVTVTLKPESDGVAVSVRIGRREGVVSVQADKRRARALGRAVVCCEGLDGFGPWLASGGAGALSDLF